MTLLVAIYSFVAGMAFITVKEEWKLSEVASFGWGCFWPVAMLVAWMDRRAKL